MDSLLQPPKRPQLLVSVRDAAEAKSAVAGGADWIDVKEPARGPLGAADPATIEQIVATVGGRRPVTAAMGELSDWRDEPGRKYLWLAGVQFVKVGLSHCRHLGDWLPRLTAMSRQLPPPARLVAVQYADWKTCGAPPPDELLESTQNWDCAAIVVDTFDKEMGTLFAHIGASELRHFFSSAKERSLITVAAGGLQHHELGEATKAGALVVAVRGAACIDSCRTQSICANRVRRLRDSLYSSLVGIS